MFFSQTRFLVVAHSWIALLLTSPSLRCCWLSPLPPSCVACLICVFVSEQLIVQSHAVFLKHILSLLENILHVVYCACIINIKFWISCLLQTVVKHLYNNQSNKASEGGTNTFSFSSLDVPCVGPVSGAIFVSSYKGKKEMLGG